MPETLVEPVVEEEEKPETIQDLLADVIDMAGLTVDDLENLPMIPYYGKWVGKSPVPGRPNLIVMALFMDGDDLSMYCFPRGDAKPVQGEILGFTRYTVSRYHQDSLPVPEIMPKDVFKAELAAEFESLSAASAYNEPRVDCGIEACSTSNESDARFCKECGVKIPDDEETDEQRN